MKNKKTLNKSYILSGPIGVGKTTVIEGFFIFHCYFFLYLFLSY